MVVLELTVTQQSLEAKLGVWIVIHYETELSAENEFEASHNIPMGNRIVEKATLVVK
ncbi:MAG: hypothetical protein GDA48_27325 [Hormoscilla sp. GM102CHS1]|nr:hypothetical protein [Hormoscilla sp. GM102CHS1]